MNFEDIVREMEELKRRIMEETFGDFEDMEKRLETGELRGKWYIEPIDKPGMNGFIARGFFTTPEPLTRPPSILPPMKPRLKDPREPFYDIKVGEDELQLYIELPGVEKEEIKRVIIEAIHELPEKEKKVLILYYYEDLTLKEIGEVLAVTESRISQLHTKAIMRMRSRLSHVKKGIL